MNNEDMLLVKSAIALNILFMEKNQYEEMKIINDKLDNLSYLCDKDSTRIIKLIQSTLKQNLYSKLVSTNLDSEIIKGIPKNIKKNIKKNIYETKPAKSFTTIDTMLAIRNFQKKNSISVAGKRDMKIFNEIEINKLSGIEKTRY